MDTIEQGIYTALSGGTALTTALGGTAIYYGIAPSTASLPYVIINMQAGNEGNVTPTRSERRVYLVKGVAASLGSAETLAGHIDDLLHDATITALGFVNFWSARETIVRYIETDSQGQTIGHAGGEYGIELERT